MSKPAEAPAGEPVDTCMYMTAIHGPKVRFYGSTAYTCIPCADRPTITAGLDIYEEGYLL
jgi:hypothetical protein